MIIPLCGQCKRTQLPQIEARPVILYCTDAIEFNHTIFVMFGNCHQMRNVHLAKKFGEYLAISMFCFSRRPSLHLSNLTCFFMPLLAASCPKSPVTQPFLYQLVLVDNKEKNQISTPMGRKTTGGRSIPLPKGLQCGIRFPYRWYPAKRALPTMLTHGR